MVQKSGQPDGRYPIIYRVLAPSQAVQDFFHQQDGKNVLFILAHVGFFHVSNL